MPFPRSLSDAKVLRIRKQASEGASYAKLAEQHECHQSHIGAIARGTIYKDVGGPITRRGKPRKKSRRSSLASNGQPRQPDFAALSIDDAARFLQALAVEWPKVRASFMLLDALVTRQADA